MDVYQRRDKHGKLQSPFFYYDITHRNGRRFRRSTGQRDRKPALRMAAEALVKVDEVVNTAGRPITVGEAMERYASDLAANGQPAARNVRTIQRKLFGVGGRVATRFTMSTEPSLPLCLFVNLAFLPSPNRRFGQMRLPC